LFSLCLYLCLRSCVFALLPFFRRIKIYILQGTRLTREEEEQNENSCFGLNDDSRPTIQLAEFSPANGLRRPITTRPPLYAKGRTARDIKAVAARMRNDPRARARVRSRHGSFRAKTVVAREHNDDVRTRYTWRRQRYDATGTKRKR